MRYRVRTLTHLVLSRIAALALVILLASTALGLSSHAQSGAPATPPTASTPFVVESYYRVRWGSEDESMNLFRKNHLPFVRRQLEKGVLLDVQFEAPREHQPEESRWDLRMTLVYRDAATAYRTDNIDEADYTAIVKNDEAEAVFNREEQRRFELLLAHWDVNVKRLELLPVK